MLICPKCKSNHVQKTLVACYKMPGWIPIQAYEDDFNTATCVDCNHQAPVKDFYKKD